MQAYIWLLSSSLLQSVWKMALTAQFQLGSQQQQGLEKLVHCPSHHLQGQLFQTGRKMIKKHLKHSMCYSVPDVHSHFNFLGILLIL